MDTNYRKSPAPKPESRNPRPSRDCPRFPLAQFLASLPPLPKVEVRP